MQITSCTDLQWANNNNTAVNCKITTVEYGSEVLSYTATSTDPSLDGQQLYNDIISGVYGPIAAYIPPSIEEQNNLIRLQREKAYNIESDPLFFMSQRGEATQQEWLDKIAEIKARYPYVV